MKLFKNLFHISLFVNDVDVSLDFYKKLGFEPMFGLSNQEGEEPWDIYLKIAHEQYLELQPVKANNPHPHPSEAKFYDNQTAWHFALQTESMENTLKELQAKGITVWKDPDKTGECKTMADVHHSEDGCLVAWLVDPDGTPIELMEQVGMTKQRMYDPQ